MPWGGGGKGPSPARCSSASENRNSVVSASSRPEIDKQFARLGSEAAFKDKANSEHTERTQSAPAAHSLAAECTRQCISADAISPRRGRSACARRQTVGRLGCSASAPLTLNQTASDFTFIRRAPLDSGVVARHGGVGVTVRCRPRSSSRRSCRSSACRRGPSSRRRRRRRACHRRRRPGPSTTTAARRSPPAPSRTLVSPNPGFALDGGENWRPSGTWG